MTTQVRWALLFALAFGLGGCRQRGPAGTDPRATGPSEFSNVAPAGAGIPAGGPPPLATAATEKPQSLRPGQTAVVVGSTLYSLHAQRGLQVVSLADPVEVVGQVPLAGAPQALLVSAGTAFAVMRRSNRLVACASCPGEAKLPEASLLAAIDVRDPQQPRLLGKQWFEGHPQAVHLEGGRLYLVLRQGDGWTPAPAGRVGTVMVAVEVSDPATLMVAGRMELPGPSWVEEIRFAPGVVYLGVYGAQYWVNDRCQRLGKDEPPEGADGCTRLQAVDLATLFPVASLDVRGRLDVGASDYHEGTLRALVVSADWARNRSTRFVTVASRNAAEMTRLAELPLPLNQSGSILFAGTRAYIGAPVAERPMLIVDFQDPARPVLGGDLPAIGLAGAIAATADRLVTAGSERLAPPCAGAELAIFDVASAAMPRLLARATFPWSGGQPARLTDLGDLLAVKVFEPRPADLPARLLPRAGLRLYDIDMARGGLTARGQTLLAGEVERVGRAGDRLLALSQRRAEVLDLRDRDRPGVAGAIELQRSVSDLQVSGSALVGLASDWQRHTFDLYLATSGEPDPPRSVPALTFEGDKGPLFVHDRFVYLFWKKHAGADAEPRMDVLEVAGGQLQRRASLSLEGPASVILGDGPDRVELGQQVRQVAGTTFLVPLSRVRSCSPPVYAPGGQMVGCTNGLPTFTPVPAPPPAPPPPPGPCPGSEADFLVIDAAQPDQPRIASRFRLEGEGDVLGSIAAERTVFVSHRERSPRRPDGTELQRLYVTEVRLLDPDRPNLIRVNVPGPLVATSGDTWFTVQPQPGMRGEPTGLLLSALYRDPRSEKAFLQQQLPLAVAASGPVSGADTMYFTVDGQLVPVSLRGPNAPRILGRTPILNASTSGDGWSAAAAKAEANGTDPPITADVIRLVEGHLFVRVGGRGTVIYDVRDPARPRLLDRVLPAIDRSAIRAVSPNRILVSVESGVEIVDLP